MLVEPGMLMISNAILSKESLLAERLIDFLFNYAEKFKTSGVSESLLSV